MHISAQTLEFWLAASNYVKVGEAAEIKLGELWWQQGYICGRLDAKVCLSFDLVAAYSSLHCAVIIWLLDWKILVPPFHSPHKHSPGGVADPGWRTAWP